MKTIGKHKNIINLIGACTQGGQLIFRRHINPGGSFFPHFDTIRSVLEYFP